MSTEPDPYAALDTLKARLGTWKKVAETLGYSQPYITDVIHRRRAVTDKMLGRLGYVVVRKIVKVKK